MPLTKIPTRFSHRVALIACGSLAAASAPLASAHAPASPSARAAVVAPASRLVSGRIHFSARATAGARLVVFAVDGRGRWSTRRRPFRYHRTGVLNTRRLSNGAHVLTVKVFYPRGIVRTARRRIVVDNSPLSRIASAPSRPTAVSSRAAPVQAFSPPVGGVPGPGIAALNRETYQYSSQFSLAQEASTYQTIVLQSTDASKVAGLHAANPNLLVLMYQHPWITRTNDPNGLAVCTSYQDDVTNHPDWFLHDQNGQPISNNPTTYLMDIGNPAYQQACVSHAVALAHKYGFDGVFLDGISSTLRFDLPAGVSVPQYPTPAAWQAAMTSFVNFAGPTLRSQGLRAFGNICGATLTAGLWQQYATPLDGAEEESWTDGGAGLAQQRHDWPLKLANLAWSAAHGKDALVHSYNTTEAGNTFGLASMMLVANGRTSYSTSNGGYGSYEVTYPEYMTAQGLGAPAGAYRVLANGVYERAFSGGIVLVNPSGTTVPTFSLGGGIYSGSQLNNVVAVSLAPSTALILTRVG